LIWKILHERVRNEERGPAVSVEAKKVRARKMIRELRSLRLPRRARGTLCDGLSDFRPWLIRVA
jgi:hypothetical protein